MKFANMISMLHRTCRVAILMLCIVLLSVQPASANGDVTILFSDDFENDTLGSLPTIAAPDVGLGYSDYTTSGGAVPLIVQDPSASLEARAGQYWDFINNTAGVSSYIADFTSQSLGTITASLDANVIGDGADGGSLGMTFMQEGYMLTLSSAWGIHAGYLWSANAWLHYGIPLPTGISSGDVFLAYYDGSHKVMKAVGGTEADGAAIGGEGKWHTITLTQAPIVGSLPQFTLDGVLLEPVPIANEVGAIDGLQLAANGPWYSHGYADVLQIEGTAPVFLPGDFNLDTYVDDIDRGILETNWGTTSGMTLEDGDANGDGAVNDIDATLLATNWGSNANAAVPEPAWLTLVLGAIPILYLFRRR